MADMKQVITGAIDATTGDIKSVYKRLVDLGDGTYADAVAVNVEALTAGNISIVDPLDGTKKVGVVDGNLKVVAALNGLNLPLVAGTAEIGKIKTDQTETLTTAPVTRIVTLTETPVSLNSKANLKQITVRNIDPVLRARIGETGMTPANSKGFTLEPFATFQETFDPAVPVTIYGRSEGASIQVEVYEV